MFSDFIPQGIKSLAKSIIPEQSINWLRGNQKNLKRKPAVGRVRFGELRRIQPIDHHFGMKWGQPVDRYYIEKFLVQYANDIRGHVLEIGDNTYTQRFGCENVTQSDVLHITPENPKATIVADLTSADHIPSDTFDCIILTQTLHLIYDFRAALKTLYRILKPAGTLLVTLPGITKIARYDMDNWGDCWRFTTFSAFKIFNEVFPEDSITVTAYGNVLAALTFLHGMVSQELSMEELDYFDPDFELLITLRAVKPRKFL
jgi:SAM-dependent methyltransferase